MKQHYPTSIEQFDLLLKIIIVGDSGTGKSCLLRQFLEKTFAEDQTHTIGVEFGAKIVRIGDRRVKLQIWDTAGQERYRAVTRSYYRGAAGGVIVYDISSRESFQNVTEWLQETRKLAGNDAVLILVGNKRDVGDERRQVPLLEASQFAQVNKLGGFFETSAFTGDSCDEVFIALAQKIIARIQSGEINPANNPRGIQTIEHQEPALAPAPSSNKCKC